MATNPYFPNYQSLNEQDLIEDLLIEQIKVYGYDIRYLPREAVHPDYLFGEDSLHQFNIAAEVEIYVKNVEGFEGEGDLMSKFGLEIRDQITFSLARKRWEQIRTEKLISEEGYNYQLESANTFSADSSESYLLETGAYTISSARPREGDVIYFPLTKRLYKIMFVEHESLFYEHGKLLTYDLKCELLEYSSERFNTGVSEIDAIEDAYTSDILDSELLQENGFKLLHEDGGSIILEQRRIEDTDAQANNEFFQSEAEEFISWDEHNPFSQNRQF